MSTTSNYPGKRICQIIKVKSEALQEYKDIHKNVWPEVLESLKDQNIVDYSIHYDPIHSLLIATFKYIGNDWETDSKKGSLNEPTRRWWKLTDSMQETLVEGSTGSTDPKGWWYNLEEVFRFDA
ncbi:rhamnose mutarotase [Dipodascopsis uninucleata]